jgi:hypothetical protein
MKTILPFIVTNAAVAGAATQKAFQEIRGEFFGPKTLRSAPCSTDGPAHGCKRLL